MRVIVLLLALATCAECLCTPNPVWQKVFGKFVKKMSQAKHYMKEYDKIDTWLAENIQTKDALRNIAAVKEHFLDTNKKHPVRMLEAATQLVSLDDEAFKEIKCTRKAVDILKANKASTRKLKDEKKQRRIDGIVLHYLRKHSRDCTNVYPRAVDKATNHYRSPNATQVLEFVNSKLFVWVQSYLDNPKRFTKYVAMRMPFPQSVVSFIEAQESSTIEPIQTGMARKKSLDKQKIETLVVKHIFKPCDGFLGQVGSAMAPCSFDANIKIKRYGTSEYKPFVLSFIGYHWCHIALRDKEALLGGVYKYLSDKFSISQ